MTAAPITKCRMLVDGELIEADSGATFDNVNPATEEVLGPVADASAGRDAPGHRRGTAGLRRDATGRPTGSGARSAWASCRTRSSTSARSSARS